jgi:uncharacterized tellurite resistance protein B-like protein
LLKSLLNLFNQSQVEKNTIESDDKLIIIAGLMVEVAAIDGQIDENEISKIKYSLTDVFKLSHEKTNYLIKKCLETAEEPNSLYYFSSKINKEFKHNSKIDLLEILWEIILVDNKVHDFESNLLRRLAGLLYISDIECGNAKKRALKKISKGG